MKEGGSVSIHDVQLVEVFRSLWLRGLAIDSQTATIDHNLVKLYKKRMEIILNNHPYGFLNTTLILETDSGHFLNIPVSAKFEWPGLIVAPSASSVKLSSSISSNPDVSKTTAKSKTSTVTPSGSQGEKEEKVSKNSSKEQTKAKGAKSSDSKNLGAKNSNSDSKNSNSDSKNSNSDSKNSNSDSKNSNWDSKNLGAKKKNNVLSFPLTRFGEVVIQDVVVENPSIHSPLLIQAILAPDYVTNAESLSLLLQTAVSYWSPSTIESDAKELFSKSINKESFKLIPAPSDNEEIRYLFEITPSDKSHSLMVPIGGRVRISVLFSPQEDFDDLDLYSDLSGGKLASIKKFSNYLIVRNNLTIIDVVKLEGEAGYGLLRIGNQSPGLRSLLTFDLQEKHLAKSCKKSSSGSTSGSKLSGIEPQFTVLKNFILFNYGKIPVRVFGFFIGPHLVSSSYKAKSTLSSLTEKPVGYNQLLSRLIGKSSCSGFGFKVLNCENLYTGEMNDQLITDPSKRIIKIDGEEKEVMIINPNESVKIHIAFTPDFTMTKYMATLTIYVNEEPKEDQMTGGTNWAESVQEYFFGSADSKSAPSQVIPSQVIPSQVIPSQVVGGGTRHASDQSV